MAKVSYKDWEGDNRFCFGGRLMTGGTTNNWQLAIAYAGFISGMILYHYTLAEYFAIKNYFWKAVIGYILFIWTIWFMLKTTFTDPGVIPRGHRLPPEDSPIGHADIETPDDPNHKSLTGLAEGHDNVKMLEKNESDLSSNRQDLQISLYSFRYCNTCRIMRPPKSSHCSRCNNCVKGFDHHCFFLGNCIGIRNHKFFFLFLATGTICMLYCLIVVCIVLSNSLSRFPEILNNVLHISQYLIAAFALFMLSLICACRHRRLTSLILLVKMNLQALPGLCLVLHFIMPTFGYNIDFYEHPGVLFPAAFVVFGTLVWLASTLHSDLEDVLKGITLKEKVVIQREISEEEQVQIFKNLTCKDKLNNLLKFLFEEQMESEIL